MQPASATEYNSIKAVGQLFSLIFSQGQVLEFPNLIINEVYFVMLRIFHSICEIRYRKVIRVHKTFCVKSREARQLLKYAKKFVGLWIQQDDINSSPALLDHLSLLGDVVFHDEDTVLNLFFRSSLQTSKKLHKLSYNVANKLYKLCSFCADFGQN